ncbi:methylated-DNA-[protein]-cysteine S-methyltransferase [Pedococcus cremeus]|uniref:methylated-DNA--[protein]-cysteine S-methyltransferase n=1 Tax=Pedococcus cremeus TaxID=587636 RepID=A0A1H9XQB2_9MICO|nr:methylated-DNA--[protein]-cysteine S-methyltransferase [Pedococcus cremeus]SES48344.1 methylated-DNA-[protein]-cysteine S-methyltransferase [Pedococcus cremeus]
MSELESLLAGYDPEVRPPVLPASDVSYVVEDTAIGRMLLAADASGALVASTFVPDDPAEAHAVERLSRAISPRVLRHPRELDEARRELEAFLNGRSHRFTLRTDLALATPFQRVVLPRLAATVGYGHRATYGELARAVERPSASRAVGAALGANPLCVVLPCHRVVAASGALTGYAGGLAAKEYLLDLEARESGVDDPR